MQLIRTPTNRCPFIVVGGNSSRIIQKISVNTQIPPVNTVVITRIYRGGEERPTGIYVEVVRNVDIVSLAHNYPAGTLVLVPLGANLVQRTNSTLSRNFSAGV